MNIRLQSDKIVETIERLEKRVADRFPDSGLRKIIHQFHTIAGSSKKNIEWISKPNLTIRIFSYFIVVLGLSAIIYSFTLIDIKIQNKTLSNIVSFSESLFNDIVLIGAAIFFLVTIETRVKRKRASNLLNELRVIAHVIDMHQLTKDPGMMHEIKNSTINSPSRTLNKFELERYLDYCSEALSLVGKVAALYAQSLPDEGVVRTVTEIEGLSTGFSRKIWQKLIILNNMENVKVRQKNKVAGTKLAIDKKIGKSKNENKK